MQLKQKYTTNKDGTLTINLTAFMAHLKKLNNVANGLGRGKATDEQRAMLADAIERMNALFEK